MGEPTARRAGGGQSPLWQETCVQTETAELSGFVSSLLRHCLAIRAVWSVGHDQFASEAPHEGRELLLFADRPTLDALRRSEHLHRHDVQVLVVIDGDHF